MGPYSLKIQQKRADAIKHLLATNPQIDNYMKSVWTSKLNGLAQNEDDYNFRVKTVYNQMQKEPWVK